MHIVATALTWEMCDITKKVTYIQYIMFKKLFWLSGSYLSLMSGLNLNDLLYEFLNNICLKAI